METISAYFACLDKVWSVIWYRWVDSIVDELGSFTLIGFSDVSLVFMVFVREYIYSPVYPDSAIVYFVCGFGGGLVLLLGSVWIKLICCWLYSFLLKSVSWPSILFMVLIFLAPLATSSYLVIQGIPHLVFFLGVVSFWALTIVGALACCLLMPLHRYYLLATTTPAVVLVEYYKARGDRVG